MRPTPRQHPDDWARDNIVYPDSAGVPGPREPSLTPYVIPFQRQTVSGRWKQSVMMCGAQMGKSASILDIIGERLDTRPVPMIYVGPTEAFNRTQFGPRLNELFEQSKTLGAKVVRGRRQSMLLWRVAGVRLRLAHGGSSTALKSDPASIGFVDEYDELLADVRGQGDPLGLLTARGDTYADFVAIVTSTPSVGVVDVERDPVSGLDFWAKCPPEDISSPIWKLWQRGTMHHWAWPCPHCDEYFIPRLRNLVFEPTWTPAKVRRDTFMRCPNCKGQIDDAEHKAGMNARGLFVAPGQWIENGKVVGEPPDTDTFSTWISGLASPFRTFGDRAARVVEAEQSGEPGEKQSAINSGFGELFAPGGGEVPEWRQIQKLKLPYSPGICPPGSIVLTCGVDVQKNRLIFSVRAWGARATSWKVLSGTLWGPTVEPEVWQQLADLLMTRFETASGSPQSLPIKVCFVDSGFRPGKINVVPENMVYEFCRRYARFVFPTKGYDIQRTPLIKSRIEVNYRGEAAKYGLELIRLHTDYWKSWVHERLRWDIEQPGAWFLDSESDEDFARQIVSEARVKGPSGKAVWMPRSKENHFLDVEALNAAAGFLLGVQRIGPGKVSEEEHESSPKAEAVEVAAPTVMAQEPKMPAPPAAITSKYAMMAAKINAARR